MARLLRLLNMPRPGGGAAAGGPAIWVVVVVVAPTASPHAPSPSFSCGTGDSDGRDSVLPANDACDPATPLLAGGPVLPSLSPDPDSSAAALSEANDGNDPKFGTLPARFRIIGGRFVAAAATVDSDAVAGAAAGASAAVAAAAAAA